VSGAGRDYAFDLGFGAPDADPRRALVRPRRRLALAPPRGRPHPSARRRAQTTRRPRRAWPQLPRPNLHHAPWGCESEAAACPLSGIHRLVAVGAVVESMCVTRLGVAGRDRWAVSVPLKGARSMASGGRGDGSAVDAEGGAVGGVRHRECKELAGCREPFRSTFKIIMLSGVLRQTLGRSAHIHRSQRRLRNSVLRERFRCMGDPSRAQSGRPERRQRSTPRSRS
jgi:hypothetical protein